MDFPSDIELNRLCEQLVIMAEEKRDNKNELSEAFSKFLRLSQIKVSDLAVSLDISDQTIYRWIKKEGKPKPAYMKRLRYLLDEKVQKHQYQPLRSVRIGLPPFWDTCLLSAFGPIFESHGLKAEFVSISGLFKGVHGAFRDKEIDLAIHSQFLPQYDQKLGKRNDDRFQNLVMHRPLFAFSGYYVYTRKKFVEEFMRSPAGNDLSSESRIALESLGTADWFAAEQIAREDALRLLLPAAHVGVERATGFELAVRCAYQWAKLTLPEDKINMRNDLLFPAPVNGMGQDKNFTETEEAFQAFRRGSVDVFCGGLAHHRFLKNEAEIIHKEDGPAFCVLLRPADLSLRSYRGIVAREGFDTQIVETIAKIWQSGVANLLRWANDRKDRDQAVSSLAMIQTSALLRVVEDYVPPDLRMMGKKFTESPAWTAWTKSWATSLAAAEVSGDIEKIVENLAAGSVDLYRQDWMRRVEEWTSLMLEHCDFPLNSADAQRMYARRYLEQSEQQGQFLIEQIDIMTDRIIGGRDTTV